MIYKTGVVVNAALSCADPPDSCAIPWKSVISWVGWGNGWDVAHAPWNRARMATLMPNTVEKRLSWLNKGWMKALVALHSLPLTACGVRTVLQLQFSSFFSSNRQPVCGVKECLTPEPSVRSHGWCMSWSSAAWNRMESLELKLTLVFPPKSQWGGGFLVVSSALLSFGDDAELHVSFSVQIFLF